MVQGYDPFMPRKNDTGVYEPKGTTHFNLKYKQGGLDHRCMARDLKGRKVSDIEWIWVVEEARQARPDEVRELCAGKWIGVQ